MLSDRFKFDGKSILDLNSIQKRAKETIEEKVRGGIYKFVETSCPICGSLKLEELSDKDRYGLYMPVGICTQCGLIQTSPRMSQKAYSEFYNKEQKLLYVGREIPDEEYFKKQYKRGECIYRFLGSPERARVLEVGCASGGILKYFRDNGCDVFGVDLNEAYVEYGKKTHDLNLAVGVFDSTRLPWNPDIIVSSHTLEHILDPVKELKDLKSGSNSNAVLYVELPGVMNLLDSYSQDFLEYLQNAHVYHFTLRTLGNLAAKAGWEILSGNEYIRATFTPSDFSKEYDNDYDSALAFLRTLEAR